MSDYKFYNNYISYEPVKLEDKNKAIGEWVNYMLCRTQSIFKYTGLPDTIPQSMLEFMVQSIGAICVAEHDGKLYAFSCGFGGEPNPYYLPTLCTVANPALNLSKQYKIDEDCVVFRNDALWMGLTPAFTRSATQIAETELSLQIADINSRIVSIINAPTDAIAISAKQLLKDVKDGKQGVIVGNPMIEGIQTQQYANTQGQNAIKSLIEKRQYLEATAFNFIGINANFNMKRESLNSAENSLNEDCLLPLIDDMLRCRKEDVDKINKMFNTNITVELNSIWRSNDLYEQAQQETSEHIIDGKSKAVENSVDNVDNSEGGVDDAFEK